MLEFGGLMSDLDKFELSYGSEKPSDKPIIYCFYHIPKCAGMSLYASMKSCLYFFNQISGNPSLFIRADNLNEVDGMVELLKNSGLNSNNKIGVLGFIASHLGSAVFDRLFPDSSIVRSITLLRDPYLRVLSSYTYNSMREGSAVSKEGFIKYIGDSKNQNVMSKSLYPNLPSS